MAPPSRPPADPVRGQAPSAPFAPANEQLGPADSQSGVPGQAGNATSGGPGSMNSAPGQENWRAPDYPGAPEPDSAHGSRTESWPAGGNAAAPDNSSAPVRPGTYGRPDGAPGRPDGYSGEQPYGTPGQPDSAGQSEYYGVPGQPEPIEHGRHHGAPGQPGAGEHGLHYGALGQPESAEHGRHHAGPGQPGADENGRHYGVPGQPGAAEHGRNLGAPGQAGAAAQGQGGASWQQAGAPWQQGGSGPQGVGPQGAGQQGWNTSAPVQYGTGGPGQPGPSLDDVQWRRAKKAPGSGWRKAVHHVSGGAINPGLSAEERRLQELVARIRQPVRGDYRIAVLSLKGGVGKTTTTMGLGSIFASIRGDRVIAVDANPDFGTLSQRVPLQTRSTVRDLLLDPNIQRYSDVRRHTSQGGSRLEVLASERDPAASEAFSEEEYRAVARILQRFYNIILTDCGTGLMHSAMAGVLDLAHSLVLISSSAIDGARSAAATLDWLSLHGHDHLVRNAVVVINLPRPGAANVGINQLRDYFLSRCRAVHIIPYDAHLSEGAEIDLARLHKQTKRSLVELAATVADDFATDHRRYRG
ncbi:MinD/ParA family ATP-binding protein [Nocardia sp. IFM 10818]